MLSIANIRSEVELGPGLRRGDGIANIRAALSIVTALRDAASSPPCTLSA
ncbi:MAG: hypothetical protein JNM76_09700 [Betaproteobacteria bacterium]|nr:hypothetical protein [Betaproteobacteria bacterium]